MSTKLISYLFLLLLSLSFQVTVIFDISENGIENPQDSDIIQRFTTDPNNSFFAPKSRLRKNGYTFAGWSADGIRGYEPNDVYRVEEKDLVFKPVFVSNNGAYYNVEYYAELDGEVYNTRGIIPNQRYRQGQIVYIDPTSFPCNIAKHYGWQYEGHKFIPYQKYVMPAKDIVFEPIWHRYHLLTYLAGDVSGVVGAQKVVFDMEEGGTKNLAEKNRLSRMGYNIKNWHCDYDGKDYDIWYPYVMPDADVNFYANWEPITYTVVFKIGITGLDSIKIKGQTGTSITCPEMPYSNEGYTFTGWSWEGTICPPGGDFFLEGLISGVGYGLKAVWVKN